MVIVRKLPELIEFLNSQLGNDLTYLCSCMLTDYGQYSMDYTKNVTRLSNLIDCPAEFYSLMLNYAIDDASGGNYYQA